MRAIECDATFAPLYPNMKCARPVAHDGDHVSSGDLRWQWPREPTRRTDLDQPSLNRTLNAFGFKRNP
jgi:hypothetical protein